MLAARVASSIQPHAASHDAGQIVNALFDGCLDVAREQDCRKRYPAADRLCALAHRPLALSPARRGGQETGITIPNSEFGSNMDAVGRAGRGGRRLVLCSLTAERTDAGGRRKVTVLRSAGLPDTRASWSRSAFEDECSISWDRCA